MMQVTIGGVKTPVAAFVVRDGGGEKPVKIAQVRVGGVAKTFWQAMTAAASPDAVSGQGDAPTFIDITCNGSSVTVTGGQPPYTYLWTRTDGGGDSWSILTPGAAAGYFAALGVAPSDAFNATFKCTVTDANGLIADSNVVFATATNINTS